MINDKQAEILLSECELWLDTRLCNLRKKLRSDHVNTKSILWELIVLHATASSIASRHDENVNQNQSMASLIQHEPTDAAPDIFLKPNNCQPFYIEVAYIKPRNQQQEEDVKHFPRWVRKELFQRGINYANSLRIRLDPADPTKDIQVPPRNCWNQQLKTDKWKSFVTKLSLRNLPSIWLPKEANVIVKAEGIEQGFGVSSSFPAQNIPKQAEDNPIYKTIEHKAEQAKKWEKLKIYQPLVLIIGASESLHQINSQLQKAVYSALAECKQRVSNSRLISAVVIVTIRNEYSGYGYQNKASKPLIVKNPHPNVALTAEQEWLLGRIDFNQIRYGCSLESWEESWEQPQRNQDVPLLNKYLRESEGRFVFSPKSDFAFNVEIPCKLVARLLVGDITADEVWDSHPLIIKDDPSSNPSLEQTMGNCLKMAANIRQPIVNVEFVQENYKVREESRIRLEFGTFATSGKNGKDNLKDSILFDTDTSGPFTVTLSTSLVICLLVGKITAEKAWENVNRQEIGNTLRNAVNQGQEIIDSALIQDDLLSKCESQIIFKFEAITDTLIRESKKLLKELKKLKKLERGGLD